MGCQAKLIPNGRNNARHSVVGVLETVCKAQATTQLLQAVLIEADSRQQAVHCCQQGPGKGSTTGLCLSPSERSNLLGQLEKKSFDTWLLLSGRGWTIRWLVEDVATAERRQRRAFA